MTKLPNDDESLADFLRQHAGTPPPAAPNLEAQIMQAVASSHQQTQKRIIALPIRNAKSVFAGAIAATLLIAWTGYRIFISPSSNNALETELFLQNNWDSVIEGTEPEWLPANYQ